MIDSLLFKSFQSSVAFERLFRASSIYSLRYHKLFDGTLYDVPSTITSSLRLLSSSLVDHLTAPFFDVPSHSPTFPYFSTYDSTLPSLRFSYLLITLTSIRPSNISHRIQTDRVEGRRSDERRDY